VEPDPTTTPVRPVLWPLGAVTVGVIALSVTGVLPTWPGAVHLVALPPGDQFADLRVLVTLAPSWPIAVLGLATLLTVRVVVLAALMGGVTAERLRFAAAFHALSFLPMLLAAFLVSASATVLYSRLFWPAVAIVAVVAMGMGPLPWQGTLRLRTAIPRAWRAGLRLEVVLPYVVGLLVLGAVADVATRHAPWLVAWLVPVSAALTVAAVWGLRRPVPARPVMRMAVVGSAAAVVAAAFVLTPRDSMPAPGPVRPGSLALMAGINSSSGRGAIVPTDVERLGFTCEQTVYVSYAGPGEGQPRGVAVCPITTGAPYLADDTQRPFDEQVAVLGEQVEGLPRPVVVVAHSHAAWVAWQAAVDGAAIDMLVLLGPFPDSPVGYPSPGEDGTGRVLGDLVRAVVPLADVVDFNFRPDSPAARELLATRDAAAEIFGQPLPDGVRALSLTSAADLPLMPYGWRLPVERNACPARVAHPELPIRPAFYDETIRFLAGEPGRGCPPWRDWGAVVTRALGPAPAPVL
jgi:hypothetical protein